MTVEDNGYTDIRGANFTVAEFVYDNFNNAKAGQRIFWITLILTFLLSLSVLSGLLSGYAGGFTARLVAVKSE